jgi:hypothetical protein
VIVNGGVAGDDATVAAPINVVPRDRAQPGFHFSHPLQCLSRQAERRARDLLHYYFSEINLIRRKYRKWG